MSSEVKNTNTAEKKNNIVVIILSLILVGVIALYFYERNGHQTIVRQMNQEKDSIQIELENMVFGYDSLSTENDSLNHNIEEASTRVKALLVEVEQVKKASYKQISQYKSEITTLRKVMRNFVVQIDSLNRRNEQLMAENVEVKKQISKVNREKKNLQKSKANLEQKVALAATLSAKNLSATGINAKGKDMTKAKKSTKIKVSFTLSENVTAKRGAKNIYIRVMRPDQVLLIESDNDVFKFEDMKIPYSATREVEYEGKALPVSIYWDNSGHSAFRSGEYTVHVFADGSNIGTCTFTMK